MEHILHQLATIGIPMNEQVPIVRFQGDVYHLPTGAGFLPSTVST